MRLEFIQPYKSITAPVTSEEIADFVVLSGPNGAGKSHLLEAIEQGAIRVGGIIGVQPSSAGPIRLFTLGKLVMPSESTESLAVHRDRWINLKQNVQNDAAGLTSVPGRNLLPGSDELEQEIRSRIERGQALRPQALQEMLTAAGKRLIDFTDDDFRQYAPLIMGVRDPFTITVSELFLAYQGRHEQNEFAQWRRDTRRLGGDIALTEEQFVARHGPPPWDLLNETLAMIGLEYQLNHPRGGEDNLPFEVRLTHRETGFQIDPTQLSAGEKALMAIAMSLYAGSHLGEAIELPKILLLDEPDASLHPSMVRSLLRVVDDIFCKRFGVKVIMATHAPSTVALAAADSLYTIRRIGDPRLRRASRDDALNGLMVGLPTLSVRNEHRRQVFVESQDDEGCYQELFRLLKDRLQTPFSLEFIASGRGGQGNDVEVKHLVRRLRAAGNPVQGILDRDHRLDAPEGIVFIEGRRTLENLVLDPLLVGLFLLREHLVASEDVVGGSLRHFEVRPHHAQPICDYVTSQIREGNDSEARVSVSYAGGFEVSIQRFYLDIDGHALEERLRLAFPPLNQYRGGGLKAKVIELALADVPGFAPQDVIELFQQLTS